MTNAPERIYLQTEGEPIDSGREITWCEDKINDDDIEYVRADVVDELVMKAQTDRFRANVK